MIKVRVRKCVIIDSFYYVWFNINGMWWCKLIKLFCRYYSFIRVEDLGDRVSLDDWLKLNTIQNGALVARRLGNFMAHLHGGTINLSKTYLGYQRMQSEIITLFGVQVVG